ncbi:MAG: carbamoyltransferase [Saprospiraceae bacterium]|nr:carbamoyltransferase [Saprospiraceae bacterium]
MFTLGLNAYHGDAAAAIYRNTELIAAIEEERICRIKHWAGLPVQAVRFCLDEAGIGPEALDAIAVSRNPYAKIGQKLGQVIRRGASPATLAHRARNSFNIRQLKQDLAAAFGLDARQWEVKIRYVEHHRSHLASAFFTAPFEEAALLSIDGMGDFSSTMRAIGRSGRIEVIDSISYPHSLGYFYTMFTQLLGFPHYGDEYKVMGLAPYGEPVFADKLLEVIRLKPGGRFELNGRFFRHFNEGIAMSWEGGSPQIGPLYTSALEREFGPARASGEALSQRHRNLAASVQQVCETVIFHLANDLHRRSGLPNLCLAGGVAQNSVANGKLCLKTPFRQLFVPPAGHDAGTSTGAALYHLHQQLGLPKPAYRHQAYTGARETEASIERLLRSRNILFEKVSESALPQRICACLVDGGVVGWFQGRAEFGPRALGNRSILADPRRSDAQDLLNAKIKRRESFRPFAPSVLREATGDFFEQDAAVPYMEKVFVIRPEKRHLIPAVTHVDGTGRLQTVEKADNPRYYRLLECFYEKTGVPILLNTSFNENEPIVNTAAEALDCFLRTEMDLLVLENYLVSRNQA